MAKLGISDVRVSTSRRSHSGVRVQEKNSVKEQAEMPGRGLAGRGRWPKLGKTGNNGAGPRGERISAARGAPPPPPNARPASRAAQQQQKKLERDERRRNEPYQNNTKTKPPPTLCHSLSLSTLSLSGATRRDLERWQRRNAAENCGRRVQPRPASPLVSDGPTSETR